MLVKLIASQDFVDRLTRLIKTGKLPPELSLGKKRYEDFIKVIGRDNFGVVQVDDLRQEADGGLEAPVYKFGEDLVPYDSGEKGLEANLILASSFKGVGLIQPNQEKVVEVLLYLKRMKESGVIGDFINSTRSNRYEDKIAFLNLRAEGFSIPETYHFSNFGDLKEFASQHNDKTLIAKHRFGMNGGGVKRINLGEAETMAQEKVRDYIFQEELPIDSESRLIFWKDEFLGARIIHDRTRPWEDKESANRKHELLKYYNALITPT